MPARTVEIGHTYAPDLLVPYSPRPDADSYLDSRNFGDNEAAGRLRQIAASLGEGTVRVALIDDVVPRYRANGTPDSGRMGMFIARSAMSVQSGTEADIVRFESGFVGRARQMVDEIRGMDMPSGYRLTPDGQKVVVGTGKDKIKIPLVGFNGIEDKTYPSCQVLDLAWLEERLSLAPIAVTILPAGYEAQQEQVRLLADMFPDMRDKTIESIFTD